MDKSYVIYFSDLESPVHSALIEQLKKYNNFKIVTQDNNANSVETKQVDAVFTTDINECDVVRGQYASAPIFLMANIGDTEKKPIRADVIFSLPVALGEVLIKLQSILEGEMILQQHDIVIGDYNFNAVKKTLNHIETGKIFPLTDKEVHILSYLYRREGQIVTREKILQEVWRYHKDVATHTLETHIYRLRQKIEQNPSDAKILVTEQGGYSLNLLT